MSTRVLIIDDTDEDRAVIRRYLSSVRELSVVVDEATPRCGLAADIAALVADRAFGSLKAPVKRVTAPHTPVPFAPSLEKLYIPSPERIADAVREVHGYAR